MTRSECYGILAHMFAAYPNQTPTKESLERYATTLERFDARALTRAADEIVLSGERFVPPVGVLAKRAAEIQFGDMPTVAEAVQMVAAAARRGRFSGNVPSPFVSGVIAKHGFGVLDFAQDGRYWLDRFEKAYESDRDAEIRRRMETVGVLRNIPALGTSSESKALTDG